MIDQRLVDYIKKVKEAGQTDEQIKSILLANGWNEADMVDIFGEQQPQYQAQPTQINTLQKRRKIRVAPLLIILIIVVVISGAGLVFANRYFNFPWNLLRPTPESVILKAWNNLKTINSENFNSELSLNGKIVGENKKGSTFDIAEKAIGGIDIVNKLAVTNASFTASIIDDSTSDKYDLSLSGEARLIQKDFYFILKNINLGGLENILTMFGGPDVNEIKERWFKVQLDEMAQEQLMRQTTAEQDLKEVKDKIVKILLDKKVYDITELKDNVGIDGKEYYYHIDLNREKLIAASPEIFNEFKDYLLAEYTLEDFQKGINDMFDKVGEIGVDLFIGKKDNFFHKIQFVKDLYASKFNDNYTGVIKINYKIEQTGINKPVQVSAPDKYEDFKDVISFFTIRASINQLSFTTQQVCIANKNCYSLCKNGLLNGSQKTYGKALANFNEMIISQGGTNPICLSGVQNYCISTQLADGSWLCVGDGKLGKTKCISAKTVCQ